MPLLRVAIRTASHSRRSTRAADSATQQSSRLSRSCPPSSLIPAIALFAHLAARYRLVFASLQLFVCALSSVLLSPIVILSAATRSQKERQSQDGLSLSHRSSAAGLSCFRPLLGREEKHSNGKRQAQKPNKRNKRAWAPSPRSNPAVELGRKGRQRGFERSKELSSRRRHPLMSALLVLLLFSLLSLPLVHLARMVRPLACYGTVQAPSVASVAPPCVHTFLTGPFCEKGISLQSTGD